MHMKEKTDNPTPSKWQEGNEDKNNPQGYPLYPASEDIYSKYQNRLIFSLVGSLYSPPYKV